jgi:L-lactate dehydrogenase complex protein LldG
MDEKGNFLADIREALGFSREDARSPEECSAIFAGPDDIAILEKIQYRTHVEKQTLLQIFQASGVELNLNVHCVNSVDQAAEKIVEIVETTEPEFSSIKQLIQHDHPDIAELQLWKRFSGKAIQLHTSYSADAEVREKTIASYIGITVPKWAVAESATVVQLTEPGQPRSTSLVPSVHIALMNIENLLADLSEVYALLRKEPPENSYVFISGPSKTADIEAHLVHGAHGPYAMHVIVVDAQLDASEDFKGSGLFSS